jgi:hypothetical protein
VAAAAAKLGLQGAVQSAKGMRRVFVPTPWERWSHMGWLERRQKLGQKDEFARKECSRSGGTPEKPDDGNGTVRTKAWPSLNPGGRKGTGTYSGCANVGTKAEPSLNPGGRILGAEAWPSLIPGGRDDPGTDSQGGLAAKSI